MFAALCFEVAFFLPKKIILESVTAAADDAMLKLK